MTLALKYVDVRKLADALGKRTVPFENRTDFIRFFGVAIGRSADLKYIEGATEGGAGGIVDIDLHRAFMNNDMSVEEYESIYPFRWSLETLTAVFAGFSQCVPADLKRTDRLSIIAAAFGKRCDAFMHQLKKNHERADNVSWSYIERLYGRFGYHDVQPWLKALKSGSGLFLAGGQSQSGSSTFWALTTLVLRSLHQEICIQGYHLSHPEMKIRLVVEELQRRDEYIPSATMWEEQSNIPVHCYFEIRDEEDISKVIELSKSSIVLSTFHAWSVQNAVQMLFLRSGGEFPPRRLKAVTAHKLLDRDGWGGTRDSGSPYARRFPLIEQVSFDTPHQVIAVRDHGPDSGLYASFETLEQQLASSRAEVRNKSL